MEAEEAVPPEPPGMLAEDAVEPAEMLDAPVTDAVDEPPEAVPAPGPPP